MIQLNYRDARPFYQQIKDNIRQLVINKVISSNEKLPSVRELAASLAINPNTIQRAYRELEAEGYIYSVPGKGSFIADRFDDQQERRTELLHVFDRAVTELMHLSISATELQARICSLTERRKD